MNKEGILSKLKKFILLYADTEEDKVVPEVLLHGDLGLLDDMDFFGVLMKIEEEFDIEIPDKDAAELSNVGDVLNYILAKVGAKS